MKREEIKLKIKEILSPLSYLEEEYELFLKYHLNERIYEDERIYLEDLYLKEIKENKKKINEKIKIFNISKLITALSMAPIESNDILDENIFNRNLRIFPNIKEIILVYTKENQDKIKKLQDTYSNIDIKGIRVDFLDGNKIIDNEILKLKEKEIINKDNTLIDLTLGTKFMTIYFYKLSLDTGINAINWKISQLPEYKFNEKDNLYEKISRNTLKRIPLSLKLNLMIEPRKENINIYEEINNAIKDWNFKGAKCYYRQLGNKNLELFFNEFGKIYSFENLICLDYLSFYDQIENSLEILANNLSKNLELEKLREFILIMLSLIIFEETEEEEKEEDIRNFSWLKKIEELFNIQTIEILDTSSYLFDLRENIYYYIAFKYFESKQINGNNLYSLFLNKLKKNILKEMDPLNNKKLKDLDNFKEVLFHEDISFELNKIIPNKVFKETVSGDFYLRNNILFIEKYKVSLNVGNIKELNFITKKGFKIIRELLESPTKEISGKILYGKLSQKRDKFDTTENTEKRSGRFKTNLTRLKTKIKDFNNNIKKILQEENNIVIPDIIIYEKIISKDKSDYKHKIKINSEIYILV